MYGYGARGTETENQRVGQKHRVRQTQAISVAVPDVGLSGAILATKWEFLGSMLGLRLVKMTSDGQLKEKK